MSKLIVEMEMPTNCYDCALDCCWDEGTIPVEYSEKRKTNCPIKGVLPEHHGNLVDYNEVEKEFNRLLTYMEEVPDENGIVWFRRETIVPRGYEMKFHIIVPAERSEHENP